MSASVALQADPQALVACTISRDVECYDLLIEDMETVLGENWGDLSFEDALPFLEQPDAQSLQFVAVAADAEDEPNLALIADIMSACKARDIKVILIAENLSTVALHQLMREGADQFVPYPLPEGELAQAIDRALAPPAPEAVDPALQTTLKATNSHSGVVIPIQGVAGGVGSTTFAVNLAWELATIEKDEAPRVCIIDLDFQQGSIGTYLDLPRREAVFELLQDAENMDSDVFMQALLSYEKTIHVLTAPAEMIPMDLVGPADIQKLIEVARLNFDYVIIDMPTMMVEWSQTVLEAAHIYFSLVELDMRSAQNVLRLKRALQSEDLPFEKLRFILNRGPKFTDLNGKSRVKRMAESLGISIDVQLPDGGRQVAQTADHGQPLGVAVAKNPLRKEISKLAGSVHEVNKGEAAGT